MDLSHDTHSSLVSSQSVEPSARDYFSGLPFEIKTLIFELVDPVTLLFIAFYIPSLTAAAVSPHVLGSQLVDDRFKPTIASLADMYWRMRRRVLQRSVSWGTFWGQRPNDADRPESVPWWSHEWKDMYVVSPKRRFCAGITLSHFSIEDQRAKRTLFREPLRDSLEILSDKELLFGNNYAVVVQRPYLSNELEDAPLLIECMKIGPLSPSVDNPLGHRSCEHRNLTYGYALPKSQWSTLDEHTFQIQMFQEDETLQIVTAPSAHRHWVFRQGRHECRLGKIETWSLSGLFRNQEEASVLVDGVAGWFRGLRWELYVSQGSSFGGVAGAPLDLPRLLEDRAKLPRARGLPTKSGFHQLDKVHPIAFVPRSDGWSGDLIHKLYHSSRYAWHGLRYETTWYMHVYDTSRKLWIQWPDGYTIAMKYCNTQIFYVNETSQGFEFTDGAGTWHRVDSYGETVCRFSTL